MTQNTRLSQMRSKGAIICMVERDLPRKRKSSGSNGGRQNTKYSPIPMRMSPHKANMIEEYGRSFMVSSLHCSVLSRQTHREQITLLLDFTRPFVFQLPSPVSQNQVNSNRRLARGKSGSSTLLFLHDIHTATLCRMPPPLSCSMAILEAFSFTVPG
jgi:hypothetical protein